MDEHNAQLEKASLQWLRANKKRIKSEICDIKLYPAEKRPITIFMAGTPGAGKTEFSKSLINAFARPMVRIDADDIRDMMRAIGYNGQNAPVFQRAVGNAVNNLYGSVLENKQSVLIDGTFAYGNWRVNIERSLADKRLVEIYYLYQDPTIAWDFVKIREAKQIFANNLTVYFAKNNYKKNLEYIRIDVQNIAELVPRMYTKEELTACLQE